MLDRERREKCAVDKDLVRIESVEITVKNCYTLYSVQFLTGLKIRLGAFSGICAFMAHDLHKLDSFCAFSTAEAFTDSALAGAMRMGVVLRSSQKGCDKCSIILIDTLLPTMSWAENRNFCRR